MIEFKISFPIIQKRRNGEEMDGRLSCTVPLICTCSILTQNKNLFYSTENEKTKEFGFILQCNYGCLLTM